MNNRVQNDKKGNAVFTEISPTRLVMDKDNMKLERIWFQTKTKPLTIHHVQESEWLKLKGEGIGITDCTVVHDGKYITKILCSGIHPNIDPVTGEFCIKRLPFNPDSLFLISNSIQEVNLVNHYPEWKVKIKPIFDVLLNSKSCSVPYKITL